MPIETIVTDAPISNLDAPFYKHLKIAMNRLFKQGMDMEIDEHPPVLGFDLLSFVHRPTNTRVRVWEDYRAEVKYLELEAVDPAHLASVRSTLTAALKPPSRAQLLAQARKAKAEFAALMRVVYAAGDRPDDDTMELVTAALAHKHPRKRESAAYGASILGWPELEPALQRSLANEQDPKAADMMRQALAHLGKPQRARAL